MDRVALTELVDRAGAARAAVAALALSARLERAAASRGRVAAIGPELIAGAVSEAGVARRFAARELDSALALLDALPALAEAIRPRPVPARAGTTTLEWAPFGTVLGWHAANSPLWVPTLVAGSALVAGNTVIARPSSRARATTGALLAALAAPWPPGAVVVCDLPGPVAEPLVWHPGVQAVVAHASTRTITRQLAGLGRAYAEGAPLRPYIPEGPGNDPLVVLAGADPARAARAAALAAFANAGQLCMAAKRIVVEAPALPTFLPALCEAVAALRVGDPADPATDIAPLSPGPAREWARAALADALARGGELVVGAGERGAHFTPTVVRLPPGALDLALWREESFAPLRALVVARDPAEALALANDTPYGLGAAVFGPAPPGFLEGLRAARVLHEEGPLYEDPHLVVGGIGESGLGGARPKLEQLVWARRVHRAPGATERAAPEHP